MSIIVQKYSKFHQDDDDNDCYVLIFPIFKFSITKSIGVQMF